MSRVGIYKIGFEEQDKVQDSWIHQEEEDPIQSKASSDAKTTGLLFESIDQGKSSLSQDMVVDSNGVVYNVNLGFTVRKDVDIELARRYAGRPVVVHVWAVDGHCYTIGTKTYPARLFIIDRYSGLDTREVAVSVTYQSCTSLLR